MTRTAPRYARCTPLSGPDPIRRARSAAPFSLAFVAAFLAGPPTARAAGYVFSTFHNDTAAGEQLAIFRSTDALNFTLVADTGFPGPTAYLRDPSILKYVDGKYYVAYTDPLTPSCCGKEDHFSIAVSSDLVRWTLLTTVPAGVPGVAHTWAPEWFVDGGTVTIIANIDTLNNDTDFKPYVFTALDGTLTRWSGPVPLGFGPNYIDTFVLKTDGVYHAFAKNETTLYLEHATAPALAGPWKFVGTGNWSGFGPGMEGPCVVRLDDGTWRIYVDAQRRGVDARFLTSTSPDLIAWSPLVVLPGEGSLRHGTVIHDTPLGGGPGGTGAGDAGTGDAAAGKGREAGSADASDGEGDRDGAFATDATQGGSSQTKGDGDVPSDAASAGPDAGEVADANAGGSSAAASGSAGVSVTGAGSTGEPSSAAASSSTVEPDAGSAAAVDTGHGGCSCNAAPGADAGAPAFGLLSLLGLAGRRRQWRQRGNARGTWVRGSGASR